MLESEGQTACLVFANPAALRDAAGDLGLALSSDPDSARKQGKAFENQVLQSFEQE